MSSGNASGKLSNPERLALLDKATVDAGDAIKTGLGKAPGRVVDTELRSKSGKVVWEVDIVSTEANSRRSAQFARIHRTAIVNLDRVLEFHPTPSGDFSVRLRGGAWCGTGNRCCTGCGPGCLC